MTQEYFLQFFLAAPGILQRVARRTYTYLGLGSFTGFASQFTSVENELASCYNPTKIFLLLHQ
jgi:hypothetical protein